MVSKQPARWRHVSHRSSSLALGGRGPIATAMLLTLVAWPVWGAQPKPVRGLRPATDRGGTQRGPALPVNIESLPTLRVSTSGDWEWIDAPLGNVPSGQRAGGCSESVTVTHTDADFTGGTYIVQAGFAEDEVAAASYVLSPDEFPIKIETMECLFAQQSAVVPTVTQWSVIIWDGTPTDGSVVNAFSSDDIILPHLRLEPGTDGAVISVTVDPDDPEQIFVLNESGTNTFTIGFRVDHHNDPPDFPCLPPDSERNAFPTTDVSGVASPGGNWLSALACGIPTCTGWWSFEDIFESCRPSGDWVIRSTYLRTFPVCEGACCAADGGCTDGVENDACELSGGTFMGAGTECASITCPEPMGACCYGLTCLTDVTPTTCAEIPGDYIGDGTTCNDFPCYPGACCMYDGSCEDLRAVDCVAAGGTFHGVETNCGSYACPQPTGSCCINSVCVPGQTQEACESAGTWNGIDSTCDPDPCVPVECPAATILQAQPPTGTVDARQPHPVDDDSAEARQGIGSFDETIAVELDPAVSGVPDECFSLCETAEDAQLGANAITDVVETPLMGHYEVRLARPITAGAVTTISYDDGSFVTFTSHPANANGDNAASPADILKLIDYLNGVDTPPHGLYSTDVNHSDEAGPADILRLVDLLNGAGLYQPWNGTALPANTICP